MKRVLSSIAAVAVAFGGLAVSAVADVKVGDKMPTLEFEHIYEPEGLKIDTNDLHGYVVVVEFWATWCGPCRKSIPHLNEIWEEYKDKGVVILGMSDEKKDTVQKFMKGTKMEYFVAAGATSGDDFGVQGIPAAFVFNPEGVCKWTGHPMDGLEKQIDKVLSSTPPTRLLGGGPEHNEKVLGEIEASLSAGDTKAAVQQLRRLDTRSLDQGEGHRDRYAAIVDRLTPQAQADFDAAMADVKAKNFTDAIATLKRVRDDFKGLPIAEKAAAELKKLEGSDDVLKARRAEALESNAANSLKRAQALADEGNHLAAYKKLKALVDKYPDTNAAGEAKTLLAAYEADAEFMKQVNADDGG